MAAGPGDGAEAGRREFVEFRRLHAADRGKGLPEVWLVSRGPHTAVHSSTSSTVVIPWRTLHQPSSRRRRFAVPEPRRGGIIVAQGKAVEAAALGKMPPRPPSFWGRNPGWRAHALALGWYMVALSGRAFLARSART